jgi:hypothetical protein
MVKLMVHVQGTRRVTCAFLAFCVRVVVMIISHRCKFIIFGNPLMTNHWLHDALQPWVDQHVAPTKREINKTLFFHGMSPAEAELAFNLSDLRFRDYTRIAVIQNPFRKMAQLYDRIAATDPLWRFRRHAGWAVPEFEKWLQNTKPNGTGACFSHGPRWRRFGAWSADAWADGRITHFVRAENANTDLRGVFRQIGIAPLFNAPADDGRPHRSYEMLRYDAATIDLIRHHYRADLQLYQRAAPELRLVA